MEALRSAVPTVATLDVDRLAALLLVGVVLELLACAVHRWVTRVSAADVELRERQKLLAAEIKKVRRAGRACS